MILLPLPLSRVDTLAEVARLRAELAARPLDDVIAARVDAFYAWEQQADPVRRRFYRNSTLAFTREELTTYVALQIARLLRTAPDLLASNP